MNKRSRDSEEMEAFNRYDERLLEDLAVYCGLALQYAQAVQITEERRASIEVTQEVGSSLKLPASPAYSLGNPIQMFRCDRCVCVFTLILAGSCLPHHGSRAGDPGTAGDS